MKKFDFSKIKHVNWFPGHMASATKSIKQKIAQVDLILEVRDARVPYSSCNPLLDKLCTTKKRIIVFNKSDLSNQSMHQKVHHSLQQDNIRTLFTTALMPKHVAKILSTCKQMTSSTKFQTTGGVVLMVLGVPNVGKSSIINALRKLSSTPKVAKGKTAATVGSNPGVTRRTDLLKVYILKAVDLKTK